MFDDGGRYVHEFYDDGSLGDDDDDDPTPCPICESDTTYTERQESVRCWREDSDSGDEGIFMVVVHHYCADCDHRWATQHGRPLNVDCECD